MNEPEELYPPATSKYLVVMIPLPEELKPELLVELSTTPQLPALRTMEPFKFRAPEADGFNAMMHSSPDDACAERIAGEEKRSSRNNTMESSRVSFIGSPLGYVLCYNGLTYKQVGISA